MSKEIRNLVQKPVFGFRPSLLGALMLSVISSLSWADNTSQALTLQQAIAKTEQYQQTQNVWQTQQQIATANIKQAKLWTNPELSVSQTGFGSNQDQELSIGVSQRLDIFGERRSAQRLAQLSKDQSDLNQRIYQAQLELAVKYQWSQLAIFELERNVVQEQLNMSEIRGYRAMFDVVPPDEGTQQIDIRLYLRSGGRALTETWLYQWNPPPPAERTLY